MIAKKGREVRLAIYTDILKLNRYPQSNLTDQGEVGAGDEPKKPGPAQFVSRVTYRW
jgi:hypothetical protein